MIVAVPHASVAVGVENTGTAGQTILPPPPTPVITGGVLSVTLNDSVAVALLPQPSEQ